MEMPAQAHKRSVLPPGTRTIAHRGDIRGNDEEKKGKKEGFC